MLTCLLRAVLCCGVVWWWCGVQTEDVGNFFLVIGIVGLGAYMACSAISQRIGEVATLNAGLSVLMLGTARSLRLHFTCSQLNAECCSLMCVC